MAGSWRRHRDHVKAPAANASAAATWRCSNTRAPDRLSRLDLCGFNHAASLAALRPRKQNGRELMSAAEFVSEP
jgi:hypothetical protein